MTYQGRTGYGILLGDTSRLILLYYIGGLMQWYEFWSWVDKGDEDDCWEWKGGKTEGYGQLNYHGVQSRAHRIAWELKNGEIPDGMYICHSCDNPSCCNPNHLFMGTAKDNTDDCISKDRHRAVDSWGEPRWLSYIK